MNETDTTVFRQLFKEAYAICFGHQLQMAMTETESKLFSYQVLEQTGLIIGWKSLKNYSFFITDEVPGKKENPSVATLDTLARYVLKAPYTDEVQRKNKEGHFPWWFKYKEQVYRTVNRGEVPDVEQITTPSQATAARRSKKSLFAGLTVLAILGFGFVLSIALKIFDQAPSSFTNSFNALSEDSLAAHGWWVQARDTTWWNKRNESPGNLILFTLRGDSWPDSFNKPGIKNLLVRALPADCFAVEVHMSGFVPAQNWQQAGLLLMEDTAFRGKSLRLSLAYNDYTGGAPLSPEILIQAILSLGDGFSKPEEVAHARLFSPNGDRANSSLIAKNLAYSALRIEKRGDHIRLLYANGPMENSAFKEIVSRQFSFKPKYLGLFALRGFVDDAADMPVHFRHFTITRTACE